MNVLVAFAWPNHVQHARAARWYGSIRDEGWATCPVTESGFVRVSSNARVIPDARPPQEVIALLGAMTRLPRHAFLSDDVSIANGGAGPFEHVVGCRQITHAHLVTLAIRHGGRLATFDRSVASLVPGGEEAVELIP